MSKVTHGHSYKGRVSTTYRSWQAMHARCTNPNDKSYKDYGAIGVKVCPEWATFEQFYADMGPRPEGKTLGRFGDTGDYAPGNCAWQTRLEQAKRGSLHGASVLTEEIVLCARSLYVRRSPKGCSVKNMAADLGVDQSTLALAIRGDTWRHV